MIIKFAEFDVYELIILREFAQDVASEVQGERGPPSKELNTICDGPFFEDSSKSDDPICNLYLYLSHCSIRLSELQSEGNWI